MVLRLSLVSAALLLQACSASNTKTIVLETAASDSKDTITVVCHKEKKTGSHLAEVICRDVDGLAAEGELTRSVMQRAQLKTPSPRQM